MWHCKFLCWLSFSPSAIGLGRWPHLFSLLFPGDASGKESVGQPAFPRSGRSPGGGRGNPLQYSRLENPTDRGAWWATVHVVTKSRMGLKWLSMDNHHTVGMPVFLSSFPATWAKSQCWPCLCLRPSHLKSPCSFDTFFFFLKNKNLHFRS